MSEWFADLYAIEPALPFIFGLFAGSMITVLWFALSVRGTSAPSTSERTTPATSNRKSGRKSGGVL